MLRFGVCIFLCVMSFYLAPAFGQASPVCVGNLQGSGGSISPTAGQNALIKFLGKQKNMQIEAVPIAAVAPEPALAEAKDKKCDYVVTTNLAEIHSDTGYSGGLAGVNLQTFYVTVDYKLNQVSDGAEEAKGSFKASDRGSPENAITATMKKIAEKTAEAIKKGSPPAK